MPYIKVDTNKIKTYATEIDSARIVLNNTKQSIADVRYAMEWALRDSCANCDRSIGNRLDAIEDAIYWDATSLTNMRRYLEAAVQLYDNQESIINEASKRNFLSTASEVSKWGGVISGAMDVVDWSKTLADVIKVKDINMVIQNGKVFLNGYTKGSGFTSRYNYSTWVDKNAKVGWLSWVGVGIDATVRAANAASNIYNTWNDENKTTEKKVCDTIANVGCTAGAVATKVGGVIVGAKLGAVIGSAIPIPAVGTAVGAVVGAAVGYLAGTIADAITSEAVVEQASKATENIVGAAKALGKAVSDKAKEYAEAKGVAKVGKAVEVAATAVNEGLKVVTTAVGEGVKVVGKVFEEVGKSIGNSVKNFFKGW